MLTKEEIISRLNELTIEGENLLKTMPRFSDIDSERQKPELIINYKKWRLSCLNLISNTFGKEHEFYKVFKNAATSWVSTTLLNGRKPIDQPIFYSLENVAQSYAALIHIKEAAENGLITEVRHLYESNLFSNLLEQAFELLKNDYRHAAAIYGRIVIENAMRGLCDLNNIKQKDKVSNMLIDLRKTGIIDLPLERTIQAKYDIGSMAAHGKPDFSKYSNKDIEEMLEFIRDKILIIGSLR